MESHFWKGGAETCPGTSTTRVTGGIIRSKNVRSAMMVLDSKEFFHPVVKIYRATNQLEIQRSDRFGETY
jgi:hypothetical protein